MLKEVTLSALRERTQSQKYCVSVLISHMGTKCFWNPRNHIFIADPSEKERERLALHDTLLMSPAF